MAITVGAFEPGVLSGGPGGRWSYAELTFDNSYLPGGEVLNAKDLGYVRFKAVWPAWNEDGYIFSISLSTDKTTATFKVFSNFSTSSASDGSPVESSIKDLSAVVLPCLFRGV